MIMGSTIIINHRRRMLIPLWMTLLLTVRGNAANEDVKKLEGAGETTVKKAESLTLTCRVDSSPPSVLTCTTHGSNTTLISGNGTTLVISPLELNNSGLYNCTATHLTNTLPKKVNVTVASSPEILNSSGCTNHPKVLICSCISRGDSLPSITWPLLENHKHFSVDTTKSGNTVNSTFTLPTEETQTEAGVECVSSIGNGNVTKQLVIKKAEQEDEDLLEKLLRILTQLEVIIAFSSGVLLSACCCCTCCLLRNCHRKKQKTRGDMPVTLEMVTSQVDPLMDGGQAEESNLDFDQEALQGEEGPAEGKPDADYSALDFSRIKRKNPEEAETTQDTTETEYAEIKKGGAAAGQEEEIGEEEVTGEHEEANCQGDEDAAVQCNMEDISVQSDGDVSPHD